MCGFHQYAAIEYNILLYRDKMNGLEHYKMILNNAFSKQKNICFMGFLLKIYVHLNLFNAVVINYTHIQKVCSRSIIQIILCILNDYFIYSL